MTNLDIKNEEIKPLGELIEKLNFDESRLMIGQRYFRENGLVLYIRDKYRNEAVRVTFTKEQVVDIVDEYKPLNGGEFEWLRFKATDTQRERIFNRMLDLLIFKANELPNLQYA